MPEIQEAQLLTAKTTPHTGLVVTMDVGDVGDIHPFRKAPVGRRFALWALAEVYGRHVVYSGPIYESMSVEGDRIRVRFTHTGSGLSTSDGRPPSHFTIAGADQQFREAEAAIENDTVVVRSEQVPRPAAVRYAWRDDAAPNLINKEGLPASPFRTDDFKAITQDER
jgi:sialate O-acetylesterase